MAYRPLSAVVLAAGEGTRMRSADAEGAAPAVRPPDAAPRARHARGAARSSASCVVVGHGAERVTKTVQEQLATEIPIEFVEQRVQRGTGDAASVGLTAFADTLDAEDDVLVLTGDTPLLRPETLAAVATEHRLADAAATLLTAELADPSGLRPHRARRAGRRRSHRRAGRRQRRPARAHRGEPVDLLLPPRVPGAGAAPAQPRERAGRVLPDRRRRRCCGRPATRSSRCPATTRPRRWA